AASVCWLAMPLFGTPNSVPGKIAMLATLCGLGGAVYVCFLLILKEQTTLSLLGEIRKRLSSRKQERQTRA
ncbi:MAG TPA: hypothetical protein PKH07_19995, partial [bacterium]|nr:hypothetical protein [bacterium]